MPLDRSFSGERYPSRSQFEDVNCASGAPDTPLPEPDDGEFLADWDPYDTEGPLFPSFQDYDKQQREEYVGMCSPYEL